MIRTQTKNVKTVTNVIMGGMSQNAWVNPSYAETEDGACAVATFPYAGITDLLRGIMQGDNFTLPSTATVQKVKVRIKRNCSPSSVKDQDVRLVKAGSFSGTNNADTVNDYPTTLTWKTYDPGNLWGLTLTYADVNADGFGCGLISQASGGSVTASVDVMEITVTYDDGLTQNAQFISQVGPPVTLLVGQHYNVSVRMKNTGTATWDVGLIQLTSQNPQYNTNWGPNYHALVSSVAPNAEVTFSFVIAAPSTPGTYHFQWRMSEVGVADFGDYSTNMDIAVTANPTYTDSVHRFL